MTMLEIATSMAQPLQQKGIKSAQPMAVGVAKLSEQPPNLLSLEGGVRHASLPLAGQTTF
jgi:hypothetical protein